MSERIMVTTKTQSSCDNKWNQTTSKSKITFDDGDLINDRG
jgi:hypothetical protein